jgi:predicted KAP-like P-loop ATPase
MAQKKSQVKASDISADRPIASAKDDLLGRKPFAAGLAKRIAAWDARESLVTALCGEWGCGKTSLKNMVIEELHKQNPKIKVMEFCPWEISGHHSLTPAFFRDLAVTIAPPANANMKQQAAAERLITYTKVAAFGSAGLAGMGLAMTALGIPCGGFLRAASEHLKAAGDVAKAGADFQSNETEPPSLADVKRDLIAHMADLSDPILIVIDDIDRLTTDEIREVFQLVKANANFPNLIYLLMFDRGIVANALDSISGGKGYQYLDKIVQVLFNVPQPTLQHVHQVLFSGLDRCLSQAGVDHSWDKHRWSNVWLEGLAPYFPNLRCVYRFLGSFFFHVSQMRNGKTFELNPLDLLILEVLRLFEPVVYESLPSRRGELTGSSYNTFSREDDRRKEMQENLGALLSLVKQERHEQLKTILSALFPALFKLHLEKDSLLRHLQVGHKAVFDRYFTMSVAPDDIAQADVNALQEGLINPPKFVKLCKALKARKKLDFAIERLVARKDELESSIFPQAITALIDAAEIFAEKVGFDPFTATSLDYALHFIHHSLMKVNDETVRYSLLHSAVRASTGLQLAVRLVARGERQSESDDSESLLTNEHWHATKIIVLDRLRAYANDGRLKSVSKLSYLLWRWKDWAGEEEVYEWINSLLHTGKDALWVLRAFMSIGSRTGNKVAFRRYIILSEIGLFCDIEKLSQLTDGYTLEKLGIEDKRALRAFRFSLKCREEGKPDTYCRDGRLGAKELEEDD